ncbi:MAG: metal-dependent transcriptional regulator [Bacilli bacterium]|nr:metal-dependent transcriptional regulator [Bacilli bacterium]
MKTTTRSMEDFLEALLMLEEEGKPLQTTKVAAILGISKPAVHQMGHELINRGYITRIDYGDMSLTDAGREIAKATLHRHKILKRYLLALGVDEETAEKDCCLMEHDLSETTFAAFEKALSEIEKTKN